MCSFCGCCINSYCITIFISITICGNGRIFATKYLHCSISFVFMAIIGILYIDKACKMIGKSIEYVLSSSIVCVLAVVQNYVYYAKIMIAVGTITGNKIVTLLYVLMFAVRIFLMMCFICNVPFDKFGRRKIFIFSLVGIMLTIINLYI